jgi:hypothetical protein
VRGSIGSAEIFAEGTAYTTTKLGVHLPGLARYRQGVVRGGRLAGAGRLMVLGVHAGERSGVAVRQRPKEPAAHLNTHNLS